MPIGWAVAPVFLAGAMALTGSWRLAYVGAALLALAVLALLVWQREAIDDRSGSWAQAARGAGEPEHPLAFLKLPSVWLCFSFFLWSTAALAAIQSFAGPALQQLYALPLSLTAFVVTGYMLCGAAGMVTSSMKTSTDATGMPTISSSARVISPCSVAPSFSMLLSRSATTLI